MISHSTANGSPARWLALASVLMLSALATDRAPWRPEDLLFQIDGCAHPPIVATNGGDFGDGWVSVAVPALAHAMCAATLVGTRYNNFGRTYVWRGSFLYVDGEWRQERADDPSLFRRARIYNRATCSYISVADYDAYYAGVSARAAAVAQAAPARGYPAAAKLAEAAQEVPARAMPAAVPAANVAFWVKQTNGPGWNDITDKLRDTNLHQTYDAWDFFEGSFEGVEYRAAPNPKRPGDVYRYKIQWLVGGLPEGYYQVQLEDHLGRAPQSPMLRRFKVTLDGADLDLTPTPNAVMEAVAPGLPMAAGQPTPEQWAPTPADAIDVLDADQDTEMQPVAEYLSVLRMSGCPDGDYNGDYLTCRHGRANVWLRRLPSGAVVSIRRTLAVERRGGEWLLGAPGRTQYAINSADSLMARNVPPRGANRGWYDPTRVPHASAYFSGMCLQTTASEDDMPACVICMERHREGRQVGNTHHPSTFHVSHIFGCECRGDDNVLCADDVATLLAGAQPKCPFCRTTLPPPAPGAIQMRVSGCPDASLNGVYNYMGDDRKPWVPAVGSGPTNKAARVWQSMASPTNGAWFVGVGVSPMYRRRVPEIYEGAGRFPFPVGASWKPIGGSPENDPNMKLEHVGGAGYQHVRGYYGDYHGREVYHNGFGGRLYEDGHYQGGWGEGG